MSKYDDLGIISASDVEGAESTSYDDLGIISASNIEEGEEVVAPEEMGALEAGVTGFGEGASFGLAPIASGVVGAGMEAAEDVGDILGLTTDSELEAQGFEIEDDKKGLKGLLDAYYESRDAQIAQQEKAMEDQPVAAMTGNIAGSITSMAPITKAVSGVSTLGKILPKATNLKGLSTGKKLGNLAVEGSKAGGLYSFGSGKEKLLDDDKDILESATDVAKETIIGAGIGGGAGLTLGAAGGALGSTASFGAKKTWEGVKSLAEMNIVKNLIVPFKAARRGLNISDGDAVQLYLNEVTKGIKDVVSDNFKGNNKKKLIEKADEIGTRIHAGEVLEDLLDEIVGEARNKQDKRIRDRLTKEWSYRIKKIEANADDILKLDESVAKKRLRAEANGGTLVDNKTGKHLISNVVPGSQTDKAILASEDTIINHVGKPKKVLTMKTSDASEGAPIYQVDPKSLTVKEAKKLQEEAWSSASEYNESNAPLSKTFNKLYHGIGDLIESAINESGGSSENAKLKKLFDGLASINVDINDFNSNNSKKKEMVLEKIREAMKGKSESNASFNFTNFLKHLGVVDEAGANAIKNEGRFARDISLVSSDTEGWIGTTALKKLLRLTGDVTGSVARKVSPTISHLEKRKAITTASNSEINKLSKKLSNRYREKVDEFVRVLEKAESAPSAVKRNALMYGLTANPAFMKMVDQVNKDEDVE